MNLIKRKCASYLVELFVFFMLVEIFSPGSCETKNEIPISDLKLFGEKVRNLSLQLFNYTDQQTGYAVLAPYTAWDLISLVAFMTSADSWEQLHTTMGVSKRKGSHFNIIYNFLNNLMSAYRPGASFKTKRIVFYDTTLQLSYNFEKSIVDSGASLKILNFDDNILASELANDYIQFPNSSLQPKRIIFDSSDFEETSMIVSGVEVFEADWAQPFDYYTGDSLMMRQSCLFYYADIPSLGASVLEIPYVIDSDFSMLIIRPHYGFPLEDVITNLALRKWEDLYMELFTDGAKEMEIELPKFSLTSLLILNEPLTSMGIMDVFLADEADFSGLSSDNLYILNFEQKVTVTVSETGTVATAYTPGNILKSTETSTIGSASPFLFFILHGPSLSIVFCGKYGE